MTAASATNFVELPFGFWLDSSEQGATSTIELHGELDLAEKAATTDAIAQALDRHPACLVLDLSQLSFIDSCGVHISDQHPKALRCAGNAPGDHPRAPRHTAPVDLWADRNPLSPVSNRDPAPRSPLTVDMRTAGSGGSSRLTAPTRAEPLRGIRARSETGRGALEMHIGA